MSHFNKTTMFLIVLIFAVFTVFFKIRHGIEVDSSVLSLISNDKSKKIILDLTDNAADELSRKAFFLVLDKDEENAVASAKKVIELSRKSEIFGEISSGTSQETEKEYFDWFFEQKYSLLSDKMREIVEDTNRSQKFIEYYNEKIFSPAPDFYGENLRFDPLMLFMDKMLELNGNSQWISEGGFLIFPSDTNAVLITAALKESGFAPNVQNDLEKLISQIKISITSELSVTCAARYAKKGFDEGKNDAALIGTISLTTVIILLSAVFRSAAVILIGLIPVLCGLVFAFFGLFLFSREINAITLSMGACFVGIAVDYSLHYLTQNETNPQKRLKSVLDSLTLSVFSTIAGFCAFFVTPAAGLRNIAIMCVFGLFGAYLSVVVLFVRIKYANGKLPFKLPQKSMPQVSLRVCAAVTAAICALSIPGILSVKYDDGVENFRNPSPQLEAEETLLRKLTGNAEANKFLALSGKNDDEVLDTYAKISRRLNLLKNKGAIENYRCAAQYFTNEKNAEKNRENLLKTLTQNNNEVIEYLRNLGFKDEVLRNLTDELSKKRPDVPNFERFCQSALSENLKSTFVRTDSMSAMLVLLDGVKNASALKSLEDENGAVYFDRIEEISSVLRNYRKIMIKTIFAAAAVIFSLLFVYFWVSSGILSGIRVIIPPFLTLVSTQALLGYLGVEQNLMHCVGQLLVLGIGVDYSVFRAKSAKRFNETELAVFLSCVTSFTAFGLLFFAKTPALKSMGEIIAPGIILSYVFSLFFSRSEKTDE